MKFWLKIKKEEHTLQELKIFNNAEFGQIRTISIDNEPYFVGKDIAKALGYTDTSDALKKHVLKDDKLTRSFADSGQNREMYVINESGMYCLIFGSKLESAQNFKHWVTSEVLPSIRKHGMYAIDELINNPDLAIQALTALKDEREKNRELSEEVNVKNQLIGELKPKADYMDRILKNPGLVTITQIAKDYGMSGQAMNDLLHSLKVQYKQSSQWLLYEKYQSCGYTHSETINFTHADGRPDVKMNTKWTQKGRLFLYQLLKANGILPTIERRDFNGRAI